MTPILASLSVPRLVDDKMLSWWFDAVRVTAICHFPRMAFQPLFSGIVSLPLRWRSWRSIPFERSFSCQGQKRSWYIDAPTPAGVFLSLGFLCGCLCTGSKAAFSSPIKWVFVNTHRDNFQEKVMICTILRLRKAPFIYHFFFTHIRCPFSMAINSRQEVKRDKKQDEKR